MFSLCFFRVHGDLHLGYRSIMNSTGFCHSTFPIKSSVMSQLVVWLNVSNTLGIKTSGPHTINLINIGKEIPKHIISNNKKSETIQLNSLFRIMFNMDDGIY